MRGWDGHQDEDEDEDVHEANEERKEGETGPKEFLRSSAWIGIGHSRARQGRAGQGSRKEKSCISVTFVGYSAAADAAAVVVAAIVVIIVMGTVSKNSEAL